MHESNVKVHDVEKDKCTEEPVEVNHNIGITVLTVLEIMSKFKSNHEIFLITIALITLCLKKCMQI